MRHRDELRHEPHGDLRGAAAQLGAGDAEGNEAESFFSGHGIVGHFKVHALANCDGALSLRITFARSRS